MAKKYLIQFVDSKGRYLMNCRKYNSPIYGDITDDRLDEIIRYAKGKKAEYVVVKRATSNGIYTEFAIDVVKGRYHPERYKEYGLIRKWMF